jgi:hypothetical protein
MTTSKHPNFLRAGDMRVKGKGSGLERLFEFQWKGVTGGNVAYALEREVQFDPVRKWRFDFAISRLKLACEIEGGVWSGGRHTTGAGFEKDAEKYNAAALQGWTVLRFPGSWVKPGRAVKALEEAVFKLEGKGGK